MFIEWPWFFSCMVLATAAIVILFCGIKMTRLSALLAQMTGWGQALVGAVFLGGLTSLSGLVTSLTAAYHGHASLAISNALGGIAAQTIFLGIADLTYRKANLEHAAASESNLVHCVLLILLLLVPLMAISSPEWVLSWISPFSFIIIAVYIFGIRMVSKAYAFPMWKPRSSDQTTKEHEKKLPEDGEKVSIICLKLLVFGVIISFAGWAVGKAGISLSSHLNIQESLTGGVVTAIITSLPELVIAVAAVRQGALNLALGNIIGGNCFDMLFIAFSDMLYLKGSIYSAIKNTDIFWIALNILLISIILLGLLRREKHGIANIGFENFLIILIYPLSIWFVFF
tara:strand:+ start:27487 stop:28512 length:1026 start_codon:yes stop_codon:yes gene_type:complete